MLLNCRVGEDSWESLGLQGCQTGQFLRNQFWIFIGRTDAEAPILWPPDAKSWLIRKDPDAGKDGRQEEKGMTEDEMVGWCHQSNVDEFDQVPGDGEGQGGLECCSPWGRKESDMTEGLNWPRVWTGDHRNDFFIFLGILFHKGAINPVVPIKIYQENPLFKRLMNVFTCDMNIIVVCIFSPQLAPSENLENNKKGFVNRSLLLVEA